MDPFDARPHCPVCAGPLKAPVRSCPACGAKLHDECWRYIDGCAIYACAKRAIPPPVHAVWPVEPPAHSPTSVSYLSCMVAMMVMVGVLAGLLLPALADARKRSKVTDCKGNMKILGLYLQTYVSRYGSDTSYPPGATGAEFWMSLWTLPTPMNAVSMRPGDGGLFKCKVYGGPLTDTCIDYSGPNLANTTAFPGGKLSDRVRADTYISGDLVLPGDCNHGGDDAGPNYDFNGLRYDGSVQNIPPMRPTAPASEHGKYVNTTDAETGVRTR